MKEYKSEETAVGAQQTKQGITARMRQLSAVLKEANRAYYQDGTELMSNYEYDKLYDELLKLERESGIVLSGSPTQTVGHEVLSELPKERHAEPMLSLDKTKSAEDLRDWLQDKKGVLSWKLDGLTIVLTYEDGELKKAVTRGNGEIGEVITGNAMQFENLPSRIPFQGRLLLRGEAVISYADFEKINAEIPEADARYKNPRNLCSGSVRQLDPKVTAERHVNLIVFNLMQAKAPLTEAGEKEGEAFGRGGKNAGNLETAEVYRNTLPGNSVEERFLWLKAQGFSVVEHVSVTAETIKDAVAGFAEKIRKNAYPSDGLVLTFDDIAYGISLGRTAKFPRHSIAFKWKDETAETVLREIEWSASRTGLINPVAIFDPVELEGTTVSRASVHNISIVKELQLGIGDHITVYKANMIIPQIAENLTKSASLEIPKSCPVCGGETEIRQDKDAAYLYCKALDCPAKKLKSFALMVSRDALNIDGLSEMTLEKLIGEGFIHSYADLFRLSRYHEKIVSMEGFGEKSYERLIAACERAASTELFRVIYGLGIPGIGLAGAKLLAKRYGNNFTYLKKAEKEALLEIEGIGAVLADSFIQYFSDERNCRAAEELLSCLKISDVREPDAEGGFSDAADRKDGEATVKITVGEDRYEAKAGLFAGKTFVITGDVNRFKNRREVQAVIEALSGKAAGSVSAKTSYLINNDSLSSSSKNKKAKELGIPIITEEEFIKLLRA